MTASTPHDLIMISAMYENGGNTTHRFLDGHPELYVYPFESQLGNNLSADHLSSLFPFKYRWPDFPVGMTPEQCYEAFFDEEMKVRLRTPYVSKFRDADLQLDEAERRRHYVRALGEGPMSRRAIVEAFFRATFEAWGNRRGSGRERKYVGYSPIVGVDGAKILADFPEGHVLHVVRNPYSAYADTRKRPFPLSLARYAQTWSLVQHIALTYAEKYPQHFHILRYEDVVADTPATMRDVARKLGIDADDSLHEPSWNGAKMDTVYPWGTIRHPTTEANLATLRELSGDERAEIRTLTRPMLNELDYTDL